MERAVAYYRVSTKRQQRSGLGIDTQRAAVNRFGEAEGISIVREYIVREYVEAETEKALTHSTGDLSRRQRSRRHESSSALWLSQSLIAFRETWRSLPA